MFMYRGRPMLVSVPPYLKLVIVCARKFRE
jgi:hypothetical protein